MHILKASTHEGFCSWSHFARVSTHEGAFSSLLNLPWDLAPKYLTGLISWSILWGGNSAPEDELLYPLKLLGHTEELSSSSLPLEHYLGAKPFMCIGLRVLCSQGVHI